MPGGFGGQTVTFISQTPSGQTDSLGVEILTQTSTDVTGCRHRPVVPELLRGGGAVRAEFPEPGVSVATQWWRTTAPPAAAALAAQSSDLIMVDGETYRIISAPQQFTDLAGAVLKVTIMSERQTTAD
jgi:hypothetical protein